MMMMLRLLIYEILFFHVLPKLITRSVYLVSVLKLFKVFPPWLRGSLSMTSHLSRQTLITSLLSPPSTIIIIILFCTSLYIHLINFILILFTSLSHPLINYTLVDLFSSTLSSPHPKRLVPSGSSSEISSSSWFTRRTPVIGLSSLSFLLSVIIIIISHLCLYFHFIFSFPSPFPLRWWWWWRWLCFLFPPLFVLLKVTNTDTNTNTLGQVHPAQFKGVHFASLHPHQIPLSLILLCLEAPIFTFTLFFVNYCSLPPPLLLFLSVVILSFPWLKKSLHPLFVVLV